MKTLAIGFRGWMNPRPNRTVVLSLVDTALVAISASCIVTTFLLFAS